MLALIALDQVDHARRVAALAPLADRIFATVDALTDFFCFIARRSDRPFRPGADAVTTFRTIMPISQHEGARAPGVALGRREDFDGKTSEFGIVDKALATLGRMKTLEQGLGQLFGHVGNFSR